MSELKPGGSMRLDQTDLAVLERQESRNDLPCTVSQIKPELDWDFNFHTGYQYGSLDGLVGKGTS